MSFLHEFDEGLNHPGYRIGPFAVARFAHVLGGRLEPSAILEPSTRLPSGIGNA